MCINAHNDIKKRVSLFIDSELLDSARSYGPNLSKFMNSCLKVWRENTSFILNAEQQKFRMDRSGFA
ncbi:MAG: type II toxin-antitoxin system CcdA family antitoxin [Thermoplasmataceae archaeon]